MTTEEQKQADERERQRQAEERNRAGMQGAANGARAVADAVNRVADAAVSEIRKGRSGPVYDFITTGHGTSFRLRGDGFTAGGSVLIGGRPATILAWGDENIEGTVPDGVSEGEVEVIIDDKTKKRGFYKA